MSLKHIYNRMLTYTENPEMTDVANEIVQTAQALDPNAPATQIAAASLATVADPSASNILADIELAISLVKQVKTSLAGAHPSVLALVKLLF